MTGLEVRVRVIVDGGDQVKRLLDDIVRRLESIEVRQRLPWWKRFFGRD